MNLHEYQGKELLKSYGVKIQEGIVVYNAAEAVEAAKKLKEQYNSDFCVIKAQVHAGGRGKGGGVKLAKNPEQAGEIAGNMIGMRLVTPQTRANRYQRILHQYSDRSRSRRQCDHVLT